MKVKCFGNRNTLPEMWGRASYMIRRRVVSRSDADMQYILVREENVVWQPPCVYQQLVSKDHARGGHGNSISTGIIHSKIDGRYRQNG